MSSSEQTVVTPRIVNNEIDFSIVSRDGRKEHYPQELQKRIDRQDKRSVISCLGRIKADAENNENLSKSKTTLDILVHLLCYPDHEVVNAAISVLANVCLVYEARLKVENTKIVCNTLKIITEKPKGNDVLLCRAWRLIGNLSACRSFAQAFIKAGAFEILSDQLSSKSSTAFNLMAIRAVRNILTSYNESRSRSSIHNIIAAMKSIFLAASKKLNETKYVALNDTCMKTMLIFATLVKDDHECAKHLIQDDDNDILKTILLLYEQNDEIAIKCIYHLSKIPECRLELGVCNVIKVIVTTINNTNASHHLLSKIVSTLCYFCRDGTHRYKIRCESGVHIMMNILKNKEHQRLHPEILHALTLFTYDDDSLLVMVQNGILDIIAEKLSIMVEECKITRNESSTSLKRKVEFSSNTNYFEAKCYRKNSGRYSLDYPREDWSPKSSKSGSSSPPPSPPSRIVEEMEDTMHSTEDDYSPVCSDAEMDNENQEEIVSLTGFSPAIVDDSQDLGKSCKYEFNRTVNACTLSLLNTLSFPIYTVEKLSDPALIKPLTAYIKFTKNEKASNILKRIVAKVVYFLPLLKQGFALEVESLHNAEQYISQLRSVAEQGGVVGELQNILLRSHEDRPIVVVSIPFLIKTKTILRTLLLNETYSGLRLLFDILANQNHDLYEASIVAICKLANTLNLKPDPAFQNRTDSTAESIAGRERSSSGTSTMVTFELDDGSTVETCRQMLCEHSEVFSAMFEGGFSESGKRRVKLSETSKDGLKVLIYAMTGGRHCLDRPIEALLDAVLLADRFLMSDISEMLVEASLRSLDYSRLYRAWKWSRKNCCDELKLFCVESFLTMNMSSAQRISAFREFAADENFNEFLKTAQESITLVRHWFTDDDVRVYGWSWEKAKWKIDKVVGDVTFTGH
ncbi:hypothetical protein TKK_0010898 [Trichogramma kaykai]|uniref:BTB domain-containing protein n=1 Tax=Trichogramma kaykai TaxID=54128 RepID=A0ABD2WUX2_9HYME